jgi:hypothetical protein
VIDDQAQRFAQRMIETWPTGPRRTVWHDIALKLHDADAARIAYADLERTATHISTAQFHQAYAAAARKTITPERGGTCGDCDGTGWVDAPDRVWPNERTTTQCRPCPHCDEGRKRASSRIWTERRRPERPEPTAAEQPLELFS